MARLQGVVSLLVLVLGITSEVQGHGSHSHGKTGGTEANTAYQNANIVRDTDHIKEHLAEKIDQKNINQMSPEELQFQFFVAHDFNRDKILDSLEIYKSLEHAIVHRDNPDPSNQSETTQKAVDLTDDVMTKQDLNKDGCLDYREFVIGHKNAQPQTTTPHGHRA